MAFRNFNCIVFLHRLLLHKIFSQIDLTVLFSPEDEFLLIKIMKMMEYFPRFGKVIE